jgi:hypothetical protein
MVSKIRESANGKECQIRIPGVCNFNPETTVLAHLNRVGWGKCSDIHAAYACSDCHDAVDGRQYSEYSQMELEMMFYEGMVRTQEILLNDGLIQTKGK